VSTTGDIMTAVGFGASLLGAGTVGGLAGALGFGLMAGTKIDNFMHKKGPPAAPGVPGPAPAGDAGVAPAAATTPAAAPATSASSGSPDGGVEPDDDTSGSDGDTGRPAPNSTSSPSNRHVDLSSHVTRGEMIGQPRPDQPTNSGAASSMDTSVSGDRDPRETATRKRRQKGISPHERRAAHAQPARGRR